MPRNGHMHAVVEIVFAKTNKLLGINWEFLVSHSTILISIKNIQYTVLLQYNICCMAGVAINSA